MYYSYAFIAQLNNIRKRTISKVSKCSVTYERHCKPLTIFLHWQLCNFDSTVITAGTLAHRLHNFHHFQIVYIYILIICILCQHLREYYFSMQLDFFFSAAFCIFEILYSFFFIVRTRYRLMTCDLRFKNTKYQPVYEQTSLPRANYIQKNFGFQDFMFRIYIFIPFLDYFISLVSTCQLIGK